VTRIQLYQLYPSLARGPLAIALLAAALSCSAAPQDVQTNETRGIPPRATPGDYQAHAQAGTITIGAESTGHSVPTPEQILSNENYIVVEVGLFGPAGARLQLSHDDFSVRINGKKTTLPGQQFGAIFKALKDPEYVSPEPAAAKSKGGISTGGGGQADANAPPPVIHIPIEVERKMEQHVQKASLAEGERPLPQAGLIYFEYGGKISGIHSMELIYSGAAGKVVIPLQP
jgi:hypothetical protein